MELGERLGKLLQAGEKVAIELTEETVEKDTFMEATILSIHLSPLERGEVEETST
jgi:hypothetical protein